MQIAAAATCETTKLRTKWLAALMSLVLVFSMMPSVNAWAAAPGASYEPGTYNVTVSFKPNQNGGAELSSTQGSLVVGSNGSLTLTVSGLDASAKFWVTDLGAVSDGSTVSSTTTATKTVKEQEKTVIASFVINLATVSSSYSFTGGKMLNFSGNEFDKPYILTVDFSNVPAKAGETKTVAVPSVGKLTYNGTEQTALASTDSYTVAGGSATNAGDYTATLKLADNCQWSDGTTADKTVSYSISKVSLTATYAGETIKASEKPKLEVSVTGFVGNDTAANLKGYTAPTVPAPSSIKAGGSYMLTPEGGAAGDNYTFTYVPGTLSVSVDSSTGMKAGTYTVTARVYVPAEVSPMSKNMFLTCDPNATNGLDATPPLTSASNNATLVVADDGTMTLTVPLNSNALSLYDKSGSTGTVSNATIASHETGTKTYTNPNSKKATSKDGLYTSITLKLNSAQSSYKLSDFGIWMAPMGSDIASMAKVTPYAMLNVDFSNVPGNTVTPVTPDSGDDDDNANAGDDANNGGNNNNAANNTSNANSGRMKAGTYTVTGNIYMEKAATGLPMGRAYLTSGEFPPNQPVTSNCTLTVDENGRATVKIPITIQVMNLKSLSGLNIVASETDGNGYLKSVTVDLGVLENPGSSIIKSCTAAVSLTDMVVEMAGLDREQTWAATMEINLSGVPTAAGGTVGGFAQTGDRTVANAVNGVAAVLAAATAVALYARRRMRDAA